MQPPPESAAPSADPVVHLPAHCQTVVAAELRDRLIEAADAGGPIEVDASAVASIGQAVLQLLVAAKAESDADGATRLAIIHPSQAFVERVAACSLGESLGQTYKEESLQ
jgi:anti-anti-sigma regulatory factor